ncbi:SatD family protein, partial [uncultured Sphaerochaeta sp.]
MGDLKNSKKLENRNKIQNQLNQILEKINIKYSADISSKFLITLGDE